MRTIMRTIYDSRTVAERTVALLGRTPDDPGLRDLLKSLDAWPAPAFDPHEFVSSYLDKDAGYELQFRDASALEHPAASGLAPRTPVFYAVFFYSGKREDFATFQGELPHGIVWSDTPESLVAKLGAPEVTMPSKKTGQTKHQLWRVPCGELTATFMPDGALGSVSFSLL